MPIYEYECKNCSTRFEVKQSIADEPILVCPDCGGKVRRVLHPVSIVFKGSGFYTTDYGRSKGNGSSDHSESVKSEPGKKEDSKEATAAPATGENKKDS